ncbi:MAG: hypothetical protein ACR2PG_14295, partial [Hyphomicrobiaceae bacterium]
MLIDSDDRNWHPAYCSSLYPADGRRWLAGNRLKHNPKTSITSAMNTMDDHYTTEQLRARGWTGSMIKAHLGKPDEQRSDPKGDFGRSSSSIVWNAVTRSKPARRK